MPRLNHTCHASAPDAEDRIDCAPSGGAGREGEEDEEELPTYIQSPGSATYDSLKDFATKEPEQVARVLKTWMSS